MALSRQQMQALALLQQRYTSFLQQNGMQQQNSYGSYLGGQGQQRGNSTQPLPFEQWFQQTYGMTPQQAEQAQQAQAPQQKSTGDIAKDQVQDYAQKKGEEWLKDKASTAIFGSGSELTPATQAAWNAAGMGASGFGGAGLTAASLVSVPTVAAGVATIPAGAAIPAGYAAIGSSVGGGLMVAPTASVAMGGAGVAATGSASAAGAGAAAGGAAAGAGSTLGAAASAAWPIAAIVTAAMSTKNYLDAKKNAKGTALTKDETRTVYDPWRGVADKIPGVKQFNDAYFGKIAPERFIFKTLIGSNKNDDQIYRDRVRKSFRDMDFTDTDHKIQFADGTSFDAGLDGGFRDAKGMRNFEIDWNDPATAEYRDSVVSNLMPLGSLLGGARNKSAEDATGLLSKSVFSTTKDAQSAMNRIKEIYAKTGLTYDDAMNSIAELEKRKPEQGGLDKQKADIYRNSINQVFGPQKDPSKNFGMIPVSKPVTPASPNGNVITLDNPPKMMPTNNLQPVGRLPATPTNLSGLNGVNVDPGFTKPASALLPLIGGNKTAPPPVMIPKRSNTLSPGIGLNGRPVSYSSGRK